MKENVKLMVVDDLVLYPKSNSLLSKSIFFFSETNNALCFEGTAKEVISNELGLCLCFYFPCSQLLPHMQFIVRLISVYFKKCALPELRTKMYSITKTLFIKMRAGK